LASEWPGRQGVTETVRLPVFMATILGTSMSTIGLIEGIAEATAAITEVFSSEERFCSIRCSR
jgi:hypothetical protein